MAAGRDPDEIHVISYLLSAINGVSVLNNSMLTGRTEITIKIKGNKF